MRRIFYLLVAFVATSLSMSTVAASADTTTQSCGSSVVCTTTSAAAGTHTSTVQKGGSATTTTSTTTSSWRKEVRSYERIEKILVVIRVRASGVKSRHGCIDPVKKGWIKPGWSYINSRRNGGKFSDHWKAGRRICGVKRIKWHGRSGYAGRKDDCDNWIFLRIRGKKIQRQTKEVETFRSVKEFRKVTSGSSSTATTTQGSTANACPAGYADQGATCTKVTYYCAEGGALSGSTCYYKVCRSTQEGCPPPPQCQYGSVYSEQLGKCVKDGSTTPQPPGAGSPNPAPGQNPADTPPGQPGGVPPSQCFDKNGNPVASNAPGAICSASA